MKFLLVANIHPDPDKGAEGVWVRLEDWLKRIGHEVDSVWADDLLPHKIRHEGLFATLELPWAFRTAIRRQVERKDYDVIVVNQPQSYLAARDHLTSGRPGVFIRWSMGLEYLCEQSLREWLPKWGLRKRSRVKALPGNVLDWFNRRQEVLVAKYASGHIVLCNEAREALVNVFEVPRERTANCGCASLEYFQDKPTRSMTPERLSRILSVGQFVPYKGLPHIAASINQLLTDNLEARFTWAGFGIAKRDEALGLLKPHIWPRITVPGKMENDALLNMFDDHGIFLFPSIHEGFGRTFLEAMSRGLCVVATCVGGMPDVIKHGENGFLVAPGDVQGLCACIRKLWREPDLAAKMSVAAIETASQYTWEKVARQVAEFASRVTKIVV